MVYWEEDPNREKMSWELFLNRATGIGKDTTEFRRLIARHFNEVHKNVLCIHTVEYAFHIAEGVLLSQDVPGPIVECGAFKGGLTAKLSYLAQQLGKELYVFDSFKGLPHEEKAYSRYEDSTLFREGSYCGKRDEVEMNLKYYGIPSVCHLIEGFFEDTFNIDINPSFVVIDVDLTTSAKTCINYFWPRLQGSRFYTHEACWDSYMNSILDEQWWQSNLGEPVPECIGRAGFVDELCVAYLVKHGK